MGAQRRFKGALFSQNRVRNHANKIISLLMKNRMFIHIHRQNRQRVTS